MRTLRTANGAVVEGTWNVTSINPIELPDGETLRPTGQNGSLPFASILEVRGGLLAGETSYYETMALAAR